MENNDDFIIFDDLDEISKNIDFKDFGPNVLFQDFDLENLSNSYLIEPEVEEFFSVSDKILKLSDFLSEEIVRRNIEEQINSEELDIFLEKVNYIEFFKEKYKAIEESDDFFDKEYLQESAKIICKGALKGLEEKYGVILGSPVEMYENINDFIEDVEVLYEFFFIRNFQNIVDYFLFTIKKEKEIIIDRYHSESQKEEYLNDLFVNQSRKKFEDPDDVLIIHFLNNIIEDIIDETESAFLFFDTVTRLDLFEEYNHKFSELLINYGNKINFKDDRETIKQYLWPLRDQQEVRNELRNAILLKYLEDCKIED